MDKPKHKDGMLAAGKKRLERFRQNRGKGNSSKTSKSEWDGDHRNPTIDLEQGPTNNSKTEEKLGENVQSEDNNMLRYQQSVEECQINIDQLSAAYPFHVPEIETCTSDTGTGMMPESSSRNDEIVQHTSPRNSIPTVLLVEDPGREIMPTNNETAPAHKFSQENAYTNLIQPFSDSSRSVSSESAQVPQHSGCRVSHDLIERNIGSAPILETNKSEELDGKTEAETYLTCTETESIHKMEISHQGGSVELELDRDPRDSHHEQLMDSTVNANEQYSLDALSGIVRNQRIQETAQQDILPQEENLTHVLNEGKTIEFEQTIDIAQACTKKDSVVKVEDDGSVTEHSQEGASELHEEESKICSELIYNYCLADDQTKDAVHSCIEEVSSENVGSKLSCEICSNDCVLDDQAKEVVQEHMTGDSNVIIDNTTISDQESKDACEIHKGNRKSDFTISPRNIVDDISINVGEAKVNDESHANICSPELKNSISATCKERDLSIIDVGAVVNVAIEPVAVSSQNFRDTNVDVGPFMHDENIHHVQGEEDVSDNMIDPGKDMVYSSANFPSSTRKHKRGLPDASASSGGMISREQLSLDTLQLVTMPGVACGHVVNGSENVSEDTEKVNVETSEALDFEKQTDQMLECDGMEARYTDTDLVVQKTMFEKPFDSEGEDSCCKGCEVVLGFDITKERNSINPLQRGHDLDISNLEPPSGSVETCKDTVFAETLPFPSVYLDTASDKVSVETSEKLIETDLSSKSFLTDLETVNQTMEHQAESKVTNDIHGSVAGKVSEVSIDSSTMTEYGLMSVSASSFDSSTEARNNLGSKCPSTYVLETIEESESNVAVDTKDAMKEDNDVEFTFSEIPNIAMHDLSPQTWSASTKVSCSDVEENLNENTSLDNQDEGLSEDLISKENLTGVVKLTILGDSLGGEFDKVTLNESQGLHMEHQNTVVAEERNLTGGSETEIHITEAVGVVLHDEYQPLAFEVTDKRDMTSNILLHVFERLSSLALKDLKTEAVISSINLENLKQDCDELIDQLQKDIEEGKEMENNAKKLENELSSRENHLIEMTKEFTELSKNYNDLQRDLEEKMTLENKRKLEFLELSQKYKDLERSIGEKINVENEVRQKLSELSQRYDDDKEEKLKMELKVKDLENLLSVRDLDVEKLSKQVSEQLHHYDLLTKEAKNATEENIRLETELEDLKCLYAEKEQMYLGTCSLASALSEQISVTVKFAHDSDDACAGPFHSLESSVIFLLKQYDAKCMELKLLSQRFIDNDLVQKAEMDSMKALNISKNEELHELHTQIEFLTSELAKAQEETLEQKENNEELLKKLAEMSKSYQELHKNLQENMQLENKLRQLEDSLFTKEADIERLSKQVSEIITEAAKTSEEKESVERSFEHMQKLHVEHEEMYSKMYVQAKVLLDKVYAILEGSGQVEVVDGDSMASLEHAINTLIAQYEVNAVEHNLLLQRVDNLDAAVKDSDSLKEVVSAKDVEIASLYDQLNMFKSELSQTKEESDQKVQQAEEKLLGVREKLSLAVTKGKGLLQQRDNLKQLLAEKTAELDAVISSYNQELQLKEVALREADSKVKLYADSVDRVEALESELSYIRNSANALRESFLQKDALLQKVEELLEYSNIPAEIQHKDIFEKVEWLIETYNHRNLDYEGDRQSPTQSVREFNETNIVAASHLQEIEELNRKCEDLLRKYRGMAEQSAMLEQSLLERNLVIQKWEEVLDAIEMPQIIKAKEPEDKIEWLGREVYDSHERCAQLEQEVEAFKLKIESLEDTLQKLQDENNVINAELQTKKEELKVTIMSLEDMSNSSARNPHQDANDSVVPNLTEMEEKIEIQTDPQSQHSALEDLVASFPTMFHDLIETEELEKILSAPSLSTVIEQLLRFLIQNIKDLTLATADTKMKSESLVAKSGMDKERELELSKLREALSPKTVSESDLQLQVGELHIINSALEDEVRMLKNQVEIMREELTLTRNEVAKTNLEASQSEEKLVSVREKLSMAIKKGKGVIQQRDALKQSLEEKISELNVVIKEKEAGELALKKAEQNIRNLVQRVNTLEAELSTSRDHAVDIENSLQQSNNTLRNFREVVENINVIGAPHSGDIIEKMQWLSQSVIDAQKRTGISEQEAKKSKKAVELLALELEEMQGRFDSLYEELKVARKDISILTEEKKLVETAKVEAVFRLEHAMANINSLLFELSESKESITKLERENSALSVEIEDVRHKIGKSQEYLNDLPYLHSKVCSLKDSQAALLNMVVVDFLKLAEDLKRSNSLAIKLSKVFSSFGTGSTFSAFQDSMQPSSLKEWQPEYFNSHDDGWKQGSVTGRLKLLCEMMETDLETFGNFFRNFIEKSSQESVAISQLLMAACDELYCISQTMETLKRDVNLTNSVESLKLQKDEEISSLKLALMTIVEQVKSSLKGLEALSKPSLSLNDVRFDSPDLDMAQIAPSEVERITLGLLGRINSAVEDITIHWEERSRDKQDNEKLRNQLTEAKFAFEQMEEEQRQDKLNISELRKSLNICQVNEDMLKKQSEELRDMMLNKKQDEERLLATLNNAETQVAELSAKVDELQKSKQDLEVSLTKASSRFSNTVNNFNSFKKLAEKLVEEAQGQQLLLEGRDAQISQLREEIASKRSELASLKNLVNERTAVFSLISEHLRHIFGKDDASNELITSIDSQTDVNSIQEIFRELIAKIQVGAEDLHIQLARKDALLQDMQMRHDVLAGKVKFLQASLQENQRLQEERNNSILPEHTKDSSQPQIDETGNKANPIVPPAVVTRGRKVSATDHVVLDMDARSDKSFVDSTDDDKGHAFKPLTSSKLIPRGVRFLVDRIDGFWVSGERMLMRSPEARLSVILYSILLHIWMAVLLF